MTATDETYVLIVEYAYDWPHSIYGPFSTVHDAQVFARHYRETLGVPGHENVEPTEAENEAWTDAGWSFSIVPLAAPETPTWTTTT